MTILISDELRYARIKFFLELAEKNGGKVTPKALLDAVEGSTRLVNNMLYLARRCDYVSVSAVKDGRNVVHWTVKRTRKMPPPPAIMVSALAPPKGRKASKPVVNAPARTKAANLERLKAISAKNKPKVVVKRTPGRDLIDDIIDQFADEQTGSYVGVDPGWDSVEGLDIKKLVV